MGYQGTLKKMDQRADSLDAVKYHAYLRKMTRYNPTRGGM